MSAGYIYFILILYLINIVIASKCRGNGKIFLYCKSCEEYRCKECDPGFFLEKTSEYTCKMCPDNCATCYGPNVCGKCDKGFVRFRLDISTIKCVMLDDRMASDKCSMYTYENNNIKCIDCIKGYKMDFKKNICSQRPKNDKSIDVDALF